MAGQSELEAFLGSWRMVPPPAGQTDNPPFTQATYSFREEPGGLRVTGTHTLRVGSDGQLSYLAHPESQDEAMVRFDGKTFRVASASMLELKNWAQGRFIGPARWELVGGGLAKVTWANSEVNPRSKDLVAFFERVAQSENTSTA